MSSSIPRPRRTFGCWFTAACWLLLAIASGAPPTEARCKQPALISTFESSTIYSYIYTPGVAPVPDVSSSMTLGSVGHFWALGFGNPLVELGLDNGSFAAVGDDAGGWLDLAAGYPATILTTWAADNGIDSCIDDATTDPDCTAILLTDDDGNGATYFTMMTASENVIRDYLFNLPGNAPIVLAAIPAPAVADFDGAIVRIAAPTLPAGGFHLDPACLLAEPEDIVLGYKVYEYRQAPGAPPPTGRAFATDPANLHGWWPAEGGSAMDGGPLPLGVEAQVEIGCQPWDIYFAISLVFDSGYETAYVSATGTAFPSCECAGPDGDGDGYCTGEGGTYEDCDDTDATVFPGAPVRCDDRNNDCLDPNWPVLPDAEIDHDGDGFVQCDDCNDDDATVYPGAPEICDGQVNACGMTLPEDETDADRDGWLICEGDCAPNIRTIYPGAPEVCDNRNNDCNHPFWPLLAGSDSIDDDGDGFSECQGDCMDFATFGDAPGNTIYPGALEVCDGVGNDCNAPEWPTPPGEDDDIDGDGFSLCDDCDDGDSTVYPGAPEICDGLRNDCNAPDWPEPLDENADHDGDGRAVCDGDCDESDASVYSGAPQQCDGINNDCADPNWPTPPADEGDSDTDGVRDCGDCAPADPSVYPGAPPICDGQNNDCNDPNWPELDAMELDGDGDGFVACQECDDTSGNVFPGAPQVCDGINNDCSDPFWPTPPDEDRDHDDDGVPLCAGDCDNFDPAVYPGAPQICDGQNNDCDDPNYPDVPPDEVDADGDGAPLCADCDDTEGAIYPGAPFLCDGLNNDCNDPNWPDLDRSEMDLDEDGFFQCAECDDDDAATYPDADQLCGDGKNNDCRDANWPLLDGTNEADADGDGLSECDGDCSGDDPTVYPGAPPTCDGLNNDCDDPNWPTPPADEFDADDDSYPVCNDCDDTNPRVFPGSLELCDGVNNDCNDPNWPDLPPSERDDDSDGFRACNECDDANGTVYPGAPQICDALNNDCDHPNWPIPPNEDIDNDADGISACGGDCNDGDASTYPGAPEICDGINNDCDDPNWPALSDSDLDGDGDGAPACNDCDDTDPRIRPAGPQLCDGINNDCLHPNFPDLEGTNEFDDDEDGFNECAGDCADDDPFRNPGLDEDCDNGIDDDCDGLTDYFDAADCRDLSVVLDTFTATAEGGGVRVRWTTSQEIDSAGFRVLRSSGSRRLEAITPRPIPSSGDALHGASYEFFDADRQSTDRLRYWLEEIDVHGVATRFGPVIVSRQKAATR